MTLTNSTTTEDFCDAVNSVLDPAYASLDMAKGTGIAMTACRLDGLARTLCDIIRGLADGINDEIIVAEDSDTGLTVDHLLDDPFDLSSEQAELVMRLFKAVR